MVINPPFMKQISTLLVCLMLHTLSYAQLPNRYDVIIDELMSDPLPQIGLPNAEWIELRNVSGAPFNLQGWRIGDAGSQSGPMPAFVLKPDSFVIVCTASAAAVLSVYGSCISVTGFPSLDNAGDIIYLRSPQNKVIHAVNYSDNWFGNELKKQGGWTLEMIDPKNPCSGMDNWMASKDVQGGTPGKINSVNALNADQQAPSLLRAFAVDSVNISLYFSETLDSLSAATPAHYSISDGIGIPLSAIAVSPLFNQVNLRLGTPLQRNKQFLLTASTITDCSGNNIDPASETRVGLCEPADSFDVVINEILFNPKPGCVDYVELFNRGKKILDLSTLYIANRNTAGQVSSITTLITKSQAFFPNDFLLLTTDAIAVRRDYFSADPSVFSELNSMPSFNDDEGHVLVLNAQGRIIDELFYSEKWHFKLIDNPEGVALERIDQQSPTLQPDNWHSASGSSGYGTPGLKNSQYHPEPALKGQVTISPDIISPDNDGRDDVATIAYQFPSAGYVANITVFDVQGRPVRYLQRNALCGIQGNFRWDGLGERYQSLPVGIYVVFTEVFNLEGKKKQFKNVIVVARR